jgi:hypothetical protein
VSAGTGSICWRSGSGPPLPSAHGSATVSWCCLCLAAQALRSRLDAPLRGLDVVNAAAFDQDSLIRTRWLYGKRSQAFAPRLLISQGGSDAGSAVDV